MRGNNKRKLISKHLLPSILVSYNLGVPLSKLIRLNQLEISAPHLRKLLFIYIDTLDPLYNNAYIARVTASLFPLWLENTNGAITQPDNWTYKGRFPLGEWKNV